MVQIVIENFKEHRCRGCGKKVSYQSKGYCRQCARLRFTEAALKKKRLEMQEAIWRNHKYAVLRVLRCPVCGEPGSLHRKEIRNKRKDKGGKIYHYYYVCHFDETKNTKEPMRWCYIKVGSVTDLLRRNGTPEYFQEVENTIETMSNHE